MKISPVRFPISIFRTYRFWCPSPHTKFVLYYPWLHQYFKSEWEGMSVVHWWSIAVTGFLIYPLRERTILYFFDSIETSRFLLSFMFSFLRRKSDDLDAQKSKKYPNIYYRFHKLDRSLARITEKFVNYMPSRNECAWDVISRLAFFYINTFNHRNVFDKKAANLKCSNGVSTSWNRLHS